MEKKKEMTEEEKEHIKNEISWLVIALLITLTVMVCFFMVQKEKIIEVRAIEYCESENMTYSWHDETTIYCTNAKLVEIQTKYQIK